MSDSSKRLQILRKNRDSIETQLTTAGVTEYTTGDGRSVTRESAIKTLEYFNKQIEKLESFAVGSTVVVTGGRS